ncbi:MAG: helix-hairpin-helix domain-containing protein [Deltaproteobacteria bacterium]
MDIDRKWLATALVLLLLAFAGGVKYGSIKAAQNQQSLKSIQSREADTTDVPSRSTDKGIITVYVTGEVKRPGVYRLQKGARVYQAAEMAGGALDTADMKHIDMARKIADEETVYIPALGEITESQPADGAGSANPGSLNNNRGIQSGGLININSATAAELDALDGIGPTLSQRIIDYRTANGPFASVEDINNVSGIGDKKYEAIKNSITVR